MIEKYRFEIGIAGGAAALVFFAKLGGAHLYGLGDYVVAWMLAVLVVFVTIGWINA